MERIIRARLEAAARGDVVQWRRHISPKCLWSGPNLANATTADAEREVAANAVLPRKSLDLRDLEVRRFGEVWIATYVTVEDGGGEGGKRFRKTDTYLRQSGSYQLISAVEVFVPYRAVATVESALLAELEGTFALDAAHEVRIWRAGDQLLSQGTGESQPIRLLPAGSEVFFVDGEIGDWIFARDATRHVDRLIYRLAGKDVVLRRVR